MFFRMMPKVVLFLSLVCDVFGKDINNSFQYQGWHVGFYREGIHQKCGPDSSYSNKKHGCQKAMSQGEPYRQKIDGLLGCSDKIFSVDGQSFAVIKEPCKVGQ